MAASAHAVEGGPNQAEYCRLGVAGDSPKLDEAVAACDDWGATR